mgnify:FL=1
MGEYGRNLIDIWVPESEIKKKMFKKDGSKYPMKLNYLDIP